MRSSRLFSSSGESSEISTQSLPSNSSRSKISWSTSGESSTTIRTSVCGLKYVPGRIVISSSANRRTLLIARLYPTIKPLCSRTELLESPGHLGLDLQRLQALSPAPFIARHDQLADLPHQPPGMT